MSAGPKRTLALGLGTASLVLFGILAISYRSFEMHRTEGRAAIGRELVTIARTAAADIDGDQFRDLFRPRRDFRSAEEYERYLRSTKSTAGYSRLQRVLRHHIQIHSDRNFAADNLYAFVLEPGFRAEPQSEPRVRWALVAHQQPFPGERYGYPAAMRDVLLGRSGSAFTAVYLSSASRRRWMSGYAPIRTSTGEVVGIVDAAWEVERLLSAARSRERETLLTLAGFIALGILATLVLLHSLLALRRNEASLEREVKRRKEAQEQLDREAHFDPLTELPNRRLFLKKLAARLERQRQDQATRADEFIVIFLDICDFRLINDSFGFAAGDEVLVTVAGRLAAAAGEQDLVARVGRDEFALLTGTPGTEAAASLLIRELQLALARPLVLPDSELTIAAHFGVALETVDAGSAQELMRAAEAALRTARRSEPGSVGFYDGSMRAENLRSFRIQNELRAALLSPDQIINHYQPIFSLEQGRVVGFEALVRWQHPERGLIPPVQFIPVAEQSGLIGELGRRVLEQATGHLKTWLATGPPDLWVSVNVSPVQLRNTDLVAEIRNLLATQDLPGGHLKLEVTESTAMADIARTSGMLEELAELGVHACIDDFGTGYSCLAYLHQLPLHTLKMDRSFLNALEGEAGGAGVVKGILSMAHALRLEVVAEGVEHEWQLDFLRAAGCLFVQGYFLGRPIPFEDAGRLLTEPEATHSFLEAGSPKP